MPDLIARKFGGVSREYPVYTLREADDLGIEYTNWRTAPEGTFGATDDGYVTLVVRRRGPYKERGRGLAREQVTLPFCRQWVVDAELRYEDYRDSQVQPWLRAEMGKTRFKLAAMAFAEAIAKHGQPVPEDEIVRVGRIYRNDQALPGASFKRLLRYDAVKEMVQEELRKVLKAQGVDQERVIEMYDEAFKVAQKTGNSATMRSVAKDLGDMLDMKPEKKTERMIEATQVDWNHVLTTGDDDA